MTWEFVYGELVSEDCLLVEPEYPRDRIVVKRKIINELTLWNSIKLIMWKCVTELSHYVVKNHHIHLTGTRQSIATEQNCTLWLSPNRISPGDCRSVPGVYDCFTCGGILKTQALVTEEDTIISYVALFSRRKHSSDIRDG